MDHSENKPVNPRADSTETINDLIEIRLSRRAFVGGAIATGGLLAAGCMPGGRETAETATATATARTALPFDFTEIERGIDDTHHLPPEYEAQILIRWGDPLFEDSPPFDPYAQSAAAQARQFGYNNDFIGFVPLAPEAGQDERGLLCINHEYTKSWLMLPGIAEDFPDSMTQAHCETEIAAFGGSVIEVARRGDDWRVVVPSRYNRRVMAGNTPMEITGPGAGHERLKTTDDPEGRWVQGTMNNCAGGITPWGTYLMAEENFNGNFLGELPPFHPETDNHARYGVPTQWYEWGRYIPRFDIGQEPQEPNRFGWVVEFDPKDPESVPKKRTALGRIKHEGAESVVAPDGRVVCYMGDDQRFDYVYKFVTARAWDPDNREANRELLDEGTLYVARFDAGGTVEWLPVVFGEGPLTPENGFNSQADVLIETRRAADLLEATPMDRPEDVEPDPRAGRVWVNLTNNDQRDPDQVDAANPRGPNRFGHIIEITEPDGDFTSTQSRWDILVRCGDPDDRDVDASWHAATSENGWFASPDNCAIDAAGRLWVATDGNQYSGANDGLWAMSTDGETRGAGRAFFRAPTGAEVCGPRFTPGGDTLFLAVQHPGDGPGTSFENPGTRWPDFKDGTPPRPSVLAIRRKDGGPIGG